MRESGEMAVRALVESALWLGALAVLLFGAAGDWNWTQAWVYLAESVASGVVLCWWLARRDPALLQARMSRFHPDQKPWDRVFLVGLMVAFVLWLVLIALDARRFCWSSVPLAAQVLGALLILLCMVLVWRVFAANSFAVPQVRTQQGRGQKVITDGPYRVVRHPMYAAATFYFLGVPLLLGSWWGLLPIPLFMAAFGARAVAEEHMLRQALAGYDDYARRVPFRLIPGVW
jgi:protein-S-isoprenylcysteine O-methyltransferase Ste14